MLRVLEDCKIIQNKKEDGDDRARHHTLQSDLFEQSF